MCVWVCVLEDIFLGLNLNMPVETGSEGAASFSLT